MSAQLLEIVSAAAGVAGALLLAIKSRHAGWAWVLWLASNTGWVIYGATHSMWGLVAQNAAFFITSAIGVRTWLFNAPSHKEQP